MTRSVVLDEEDLALVEALQRDPRAPWTEVAAMVGTNAVTASRRWERLRASGLPVRMVTASIDERLNDSAFIVPGLGDAGDRQFGAV